MLTKIAPQIDFKDAIFSDFDSFRHKKTLIKSLAIAVHQGQLTIIFLYTFFISETYPFIHFYRSNYIKILF